MFFLLLFRLFRLYFFDNTDYSCVFLSTALKIFFSLLAVIDFCLTKILFCDKETNYRNLRLCWASKTNCHQRKGRMTIGNAKEFEKLTFMNNSFLLFLVLIVKRTDYFGH